MTVEEEIQSILITEHKFTNNLNFSWKDHSWAVAEHCPEHLDPKKYNWENDSHYIAQYCPQHFNPELYNWETYSHHVAQFCPDKIEPKLYNWERYSYYVAQYCPNKIVTKLYNWEHFSATLLFHHPNHKYLKHCIWNTQAIKRLQYLIKRYTSILEKYKNQLSDLLNPTKREILLTKIAKDAKISKI